MTYPCEERSCCSRQARDFPASILLADADSLPRTALGTILRSAGYFVWEAASLQETQELLREVRFDLVFVDFVGVSPEELAGIGKILRCSPQTRYIIADGFTRNALHRLADVAMHAVVSGDRLYPHILLRTVCQTHERDSND